MTYRTVAAPSVFHDDDVKGSRFAAWVAPAATTDEALGVVDEARARWPDADHHTFAFKLRDGGRRTFDAGEPRESAGRPILAMIEGHDVVDVVVVVARWFGGTKLGVGGLMRAYGGCAGRALDRAEIVERILEVRVTITHDYADTAGVGAAIAQVGARIAEARYEDRVTVELVVAQAGLLPLDAALRDRTAGRVGLGETA